MNQHIQVKVIMIVFFFSCIKIWKQEGPIFCHDAADEVRVQSQRQKLIDKVLNREEDYRRQQENYSNYEQTCNGRPLEPMCANPRQMRNGVKSYVCKNTGKHPCQVNKKDIYIPRGVIKKLNLQLIRENQDGNKVCDKKYEPAKTNEKNCNADSRQQQSRFS